MSSQTAAIEPANSTTLYAAQRQMARRAATVGLLMRHCANAVVVVVTLLDPDSLATSSGRWLLAVLGVWSLYRIATRSQSRSAIALDYVLILAVCAAIPLLLTDPGFYTRNSAPVAVAGTGVISFAVALPARVTLPMTLCIAAAFAAGSARIIGWEHVPHVFNLYYFGVQWATSALIRLMLLRVAAAVDRARSDRHIAELNEQVSHAVRDYEREQLALLHDTAASTLLMVGQGTALPPARLAAQARRDLALLDQGPWVAPPPRVELVAALRECAAHISTAVQFAGAAELWLDGDTAKAVIAAAREAMNNVDRHAQAELLTITVACESVMLHDNGIGFEPGARSGGHGITDSIIDRMRRVGGDARIDSAIGAGTNTELNWNRPDRQLSTEIDGSDPERLIERIRRRYGLVLTGYAVANLLVMVPYSFVAQDHQWAQVALAATALAGALTAVPGIRSGRWRPARLGAGALLLVTVAQPLLLPVNEIGGQHHWTQGVIGWCALPLVLGLSTPRGATCLVGYWIAGAAVELAREFSAALMVNVGLGTASILAVQLFALAFNGLMRAAAADAQAETETRQQLIRRERIASALRTEYQHRYAAIVNSVVPLLETLGRGRPADDELQRRARAESRRLRVLFDQASAFDHPLMQQLRPALDDAAVRHVDVVVDLSGGLPHLDDSGIAALIEPLTKVLNASTASARIVLCTAPQEITASIVSQQTEDPEGIAAKLIGAGYVDVVTTDETVWLLVRHHLTETAGGHDFAG
jgi:signal transduction histidine kinase